MLKTILPNLASFLAFKVFGTKPFCQTKGKICAHCETEIAEKTAFVIAEMLRKRSTSLGDPAVSKELRTMATSISDGAWYEDFDKISSV